ncbi:Beta-1,3-galactosyltransferase 6 [Actinomortierella ambigua]|nr:Beta-1,3-galactosyltransferase 6 [Actinomortierella ambigua]
MQPPLYSLRSVPLQYLRFSRALRILCLCPAIWGVYGHFLQIKEIHQRDAREMLTLKSTVLDNYVGILWCLLDGLWSFYLTNGLVRRWFTYYEPRPALIRQFTLATIFWFSVASIVNFFGSDQPIWPWMLIAVILAVAQTIQHIHFRFRGMYKMDVVMRPRGDTRALILKTLIVPGGIVSFLTMIMLLYQNALRPSTSETLATNAISAISTINSGKAVIGAAKLQVLILVLSSWSPKGFEKRQTFRETTLKLMPPMSPDISYMYKFVLGEPPSARIKSSLGNKIQEEQEMHDDLLLLQVSDKYEDLSLKVFKAMEWSNQYKFDFLCKTDDDIFVRWDTVASELMDLGPTHYYWRGLAHWNMIPITNKANKNIDSQFKLGTLPPFTAGSLYILSRDIISILTYPGPRLFTKNEDQNIGIWLHPFNIRPIHDRRMQQWDVCEDDMIAKHFSDAFEPLESMHDMYKNIKEHRSMCHGFRQHFCAACYSCIGRANHWRDWGFDCDSIRGVTMLGRNDLYQAGGSGGGAGGGGAGAIEIMDEMPRFKKNEEWIVPGVLTESSSIFSDTDDWGRLHWAIWTTDPSSTWLLRHYQTIDSLFVQNPNAVLIVLSNTLPAQFFADYTKHGYKIHVLPFSKETLLKRRWFFGPRSEEWLKRWDDWEKGGQFFPIHLSDYLRLVVLYKYGGLYMDLDAMWLRPPGNGMAEFIGSDVSDTESDRSWTLDERNTYLPNGVMRFRRGRAMFRHIAEDVFSLANYDAECFNCGGPKAFTVYARAHRSDMEKSGVVILPREALYPYNWREIEAGIKASSDAEQELARIEERSIGLHLYGKVTNKKSIEHGSVVDLVAQKWSLDLSRFASGGLADHAPGLKLQGPKTIYYRMTMAGRALDLKHSLLDKVPGAFRGVDAVFVRGFDMASLSTTTGAGVQQQQQQPVPKVRRKAMIQISVRDGQISMDGTTGAGTRRVEMDLGDTTTLAQLNLALSRIVYRPPAVGLTTWQGTDVVSIQVQFGELKENLSVEVVRRTA